MKKLGYLIVLLISFMFISGVSATPATDSIDLKSVTAKLSVSMSREDVSIPTLGRHHNNLYKMTLTNTYNGNTAKTFCADSGKKASSGTTYVIDREIIESETLYRKIYQYGVSASTDTQYFVAQAAFWLLIEGKSLSYDNVSNVVQDIEINSNCESYVSMYGYVSSSEASKVCSNAKNQGLGSSEYILNQIMLKYRQKNLHIPYNQYISRVWPAYKEKITSSARNETLKFLNYNSYYSGKLYLWKSASGDHQPMIGPLTGAAGKMTCTKEDGTIVDFTDEYNACILGGTEPKQCESKYKLLYCPNSVPRYSVLTNIGSASCDNTNESNLGKSFEYTVLDPLGNDSEYGKFAKQINQYCHLFCLETEAYQIFPGNVRPAASVGTYVIWPTSDATITSAYGNNYPLKFSGKKECTVQVIPNVQNPNNVEKIYKKLETDASNLNNGSANIYVGRTYDSSRLAAHCDDYNPPCTYWENEVEKTSAAIAAMQSEYDAAKAAIAEYNEEMAACEEENAGCEDDLDCTGTIINGACVGGSWEDSCDWSCEPDYPDWADDVIDEYDALQDYLALAKNHANACRNHQNNCNKFSDIVEEITNMAASLKACATYGVSEAYNFVTNVELSWGDPEYGRVIPDGELEKEVIYSTTIENNMTFPYQSGSALYGNNFNSIKNTMTNGIIKFVQNDMLTRKLVTTADVTYSLPTTNLLYNYVVKRNNKYVSQTEQPSPGSNYTTVGFSNLPISFDANSGLYNLTLSNITYGEDGQYQPNEYVCNYKVTKTPTSECLCPPGTKYEGKDLSSILINNKLTCSNAQKQYCDAIANPYICTKDDGSIVDISECMYNKDDYFACYDEYCTNDSKDKYCPAPYNNINLTPCLNNGHSYDYCYNLFCDGDLGDDEEFHCINTNGVDGEMDITSCVITKMSQGLSKQQAIIDCDALICPIGGLRIIYRTISLENPFPGRNIANVVTGFNDDVKGRTPGSNWNNLDLVKNHILTVTRQGKTYDGSNLYLEAEPLYTFELTTSTINAIRDYNDQQVGSGGYADFKLDCKKGNSTACVSSFVHNNELSGLVSGVCANSVSLSNFYTCSGD